MSREFLVDLAGTAALGVLIYLFAFGMFTG